MFSNVTNSFIFDIANGLLSLLDIAIMAIIASAIIVWILTKTYNNPRYQNSLVVYFEITYLEARLYFPSSDLDEWAKKNKLCIVHSTTAEEPPLDTYSITATKEWVEEHCPVILSKKDRYKYCTIPEDNRVPIGKYAKFKRWKPKNFRVFKEPPITKK